MAFRLDHLFVLTDAHDAAVERLSEAGFTVAAQRDHPGQGTANRCIFFENGYLEFLWVADRDEVTAPITRPTELDERSRWRETAASPFGIAMRVDPSAGDPVPFPYIPYRPAYLPEPAAILLADEPAARGAPLVFVVPPDLAARGSGPNHACGAQAVSDVRLAATVTPSVSPALTMLAQHKFCQIEVASAPHLHIELDQGRQGLSIDLGPDTPLSIAW